MAITLEELVVELRAENKQLIAAMTTSQAVTAKAMEGIASSLGGLSKKADGETRKTGDSIKSLGDLFSSELEGRGAQSVGALSEVLSGPLVRSLGLVAAGTAAAAYGIKTWVDLVTTAEKNQQIANSFDALAKSAGLAGDALREGMIMASNGLADDDAILAAANKAIVQLDDNASVLPKTMELARKATALFGGDLVVNFETFNTALATGNTRLLKQFGIIVDVDAAQAKYAESIGVSVDKLNDAGKRQAMMNAALEQATKKLRDVDESAIKTTNSLSRLWTSIGNVGDELAEATGGAGLLSRALEWLTDAADGTALLIKNMTTKDLNAQLVMSQTEVSRLTDEMKILEEKAASSSGLDKSMLIRSLGATRVELAKAKDEFAALQSQIEQAEKAGGGTAPIEQGPSKDEQIKSDIEAEERKRVAADLAKFEMDERAKSAAHGKKLAEDAILGIEEENAVKTQLLADQQLRETEMLTAAYAQNLITLDQFNAAQKARKDKAEKDDIARAERQHRKEIELQNMKLQAMSTLMGGLSALAYAGGRETFGIGKRLAQAQAMIDGYRAVNAALANPPGPPFSIITAVGIGAMTLANVKRIEAQQFATGGTVPGIGFKDTVPSMLTPGEEVVDKSTSHRLRQFLSDSMETGNGRTVAAPQVDVHLHFDGERAIPWIEAKLVERIRLGVSDLGQALAG